MKKLKAIWNIIRSEKFILRSYLGADKDQWMLFTNDHNLTEKDKFISEALNPIAAKVLPESNKAPIKTKNQVKELLKSFT